MLTENLLATAEDVFGKFQLAGQSRDYLVELEADGGERDLKFGPIRV